MQLASHGMGAACAIAMSGIDMALLDLKAKVLGVPMYELLGGRYRDRILLYANYWFLEGDGTPEDYARQAKIIRDKGFTGAKFDPFAHTSYLYGDHLSTNLALTRDQEDHAFAIAKAVRDALGLDAAIMIETHAMLNMQTAVKMARRMSELDITWFEEPVGPENVNTLAEVRRRLDDAITVCVGERHYTRNGILPVLERQICDIVMPDVTRCGGPSELKRMATLAEAYGALVAPHNPNGPLSTLASGHVCASIPNFFRQEFMVQDVPWRDTVITHPIDVSDGHLQLSDRPGLGVDLVESEMEAHPGIRDLGRDGFYV
jgi:galactonate dehydratase